MNTQAIDCCALAIGTGSRVYTIKTGHSRTGMARRYRVLVPRDGRIEDITSAVASVCGYRLRDDSLEVRGAGFSATQDIAQSLAQHLYGNVGALIGESL